MSIGRSSNPTVGAVQRGPDPRRGPFRERPGRPRRRRRERHRRAEPPAVEVGGERLLAREHREGDHAPRAGGDADRSPRTVDDGEHDPAVVGRVHAEMVARSWEIGHTPRTMSRIHVSFDSKKKLWRPCRKARAQGL